MAYQFRFPDVGEGIAEGVLVKWKVKTGDVIKEDAALADVETAKALVEIPSPRAGTVLQLHAAEGQTIHVGDVLVTIGEAGEKVASIPVTAAPQKIELAKPEPVVQKIAQPSGVLALPAARQKATELGVDLSTIKGTGKDGMIIVADVEATAKGAVVQEVKSVQPPSGPSVGFDKSGRIMSVPLTAVRKAIADSMTLSKQTIPQVTHIDEADVTALEALRQKKKEYAENKGIHLTMLPVLMKATVASLKTYPYLNAVFDAPKQMIHIREYYNFGFAVNTPQGLFVPVIKGVDTRSILDIAKKLEILATHCRDRDIKPEDMSGASFTFTNIGSYGGIAATPIIPPGTCAILGIYRMREKPVVKDGVIVVRKIMPLSITFDHRVVDGAIAAQFLSDLIKHLEDPELYFVDV
ncbi:2-oxo acid dehydrogenase subunit E2 [Candidatus Woesearchaeota archaeon]|nr:2-oxo acid dehydrogenase subunit E2 [Candidatus Woesearchaeota archaeon]